MKQIEKQQTLKPNKKVVDEIKDVYVEGALAEVDEEKRAEVRNLRQLVENEVGEEEQKEAVEAQRKEKKVMSNAGGTQTQEEEIGQNRRRRKRQEG